MAWLMFSLLVPNLYINTYRNEFIAVTIMNMHTFLVRLRILLLLICTFESVLAWILLSPCTDNRCRSRKLLVRTKQRQTQYCNSLSYKSSTQCYLFFTNPSTSSLPLHIGNNSNATTNSTLIANTALLQIRHNPSELPWSIDTETVGQRVVVRMMEYADIEAIIQMNLEEYGSGPAYFPWTNVKLMESWFDRQFLRYLIDISCRMKISQYYTIMQPLSVSPSKRINHEANDDQATKSTTTNDHAIIVLEIWNESNKNKVVVGMIEVSLQPYDPYSTPHPIPIPLWVKRLVAAGTLTSDTSRVANSNTPMQQQKTVLVGWITNVLVQQQYRQRGLSKVLLRAAEFFAKQYWDCTSIHLHCDADPISGNVSQSLYTKNGYQPNPSIRTKTQHNQQQQHYDTMFLSTPPIPSVVDIEGVPLLYLYKEL